MALSRVATTVYSNATTADFTVSLSGTGSNRAVVVVATCRRGSVSTLSSMTIGGNSCTVHANLSVDGGEASSSAVAYLLDTGHPGAGSHTLDATWSGGTEADFVYYVHELTGAHQTTLLSSLASNTATALANGGTIDVTLAGASGEYALTYAASARASSASASGGHTVDADATLISSDYSNRNRAACAYDDVVSSASLTYTWTMSHDGASIMASVIAGAFAVYAAAAGGVSIPVIINHLRHQGIS